MVNEPPPKYSTSPTHVFRVATLEPPLLDAGLAVYLPVQCCLSNGDQRGVDDVPLSRFRAEIACSLQMKQRPFPDQTEEFYSVGFPHNVASVAAFEVPQSFQCYCPWLLQDLRGRLGIHHGHGLLVRCRWKSLVAWQSSHSLCQGGGHIRAQAGVCIEIDRRIHVCRHVTFAVSW